MQSVTEKVTRSAIGNLIKRGFSCQTEVRLSNKKRCDLVCIDIKGSVIIVEVKISKSDFIRDTKYRTYLDYCDQFYFAVPHTLSIEVPEDCGLMVLDKSGHCKVKKKAKKLKPNLKKKTDLIYRLAMRLGHSRFNTVRRKYYV
jgi:hypothetical protein